jgi:DNA-binding transcriptional regulator LsrR (DeoR family)
MTNKSANQYHNDLTEVSHLLAAAFLAADRMRSDRSKPMMALLNVIEHKVKEIRENTMIFGGISDPDSKSPALKLETSNAVDVGKLAKWCAAGGLFGAVMLFLFRHLPRML